MIQRSNPAECLKTMVGPVVLLLTLPLLCRCNQGVSDSGLEPAADDASVDLAKDSLARDSATSRDDGRVATEGGSTNSSRCPNNGLFCEGFETGSLDGKSWLKIEGKGTVAVDTTRPNIGSSYSLHVKLDNIDPAYLNYARIVTLKSFPVAGKRLFVRAFVYIDANAERHFSAMWLKSTESVPATVTYLVNVVPLAPTLSGQPELFRYLYYSGKEYDVQPKSAELAGHLMSRDAAVIGRWTCWEWEIRGTDNELAFSADEKVLPSFTITKDKHWLVPKNATLGFGFAIAHLEPTFPAGLNLWFDDIAVSNERIGCTL